MDKRHLHHFWRQLRRIKPWYFLVVAVISAASGVYALRANNEHMIQLRDAVYAADKANTDVQQPLRALQVYVTAHMNTNLNAGQTPVYPPIQLKYTYERLVQAQVDRVRQSNSQLYNDAQKYCEQQNSTDVSGRNRVPCIQQYVQSHNTEQAPPIPPDLYKFAFVTPRWSADRAGWSLLLAALTGATAVILFIVNKWFRKNIA